jgi:hypothetical protein
MLTEILSLFIVALAAFVIRWVFQYLSKKFDLAPEIQTKIIEVVKTQVESVESAAQKVINHQLNKIPSQNKLMSAVHMIENKLSEAHIKLPKEVIIKYINNVLESSLTHPSMTPGVNAETVTIEKDSSDA